MIAGDVQADADQLAHHLRDAGEIIGIYSLEDPRDGEIFYVGRSVVPKRRLGEHITEARSGRMENRALRRWLLQLDALGMRPVLNIEAECRSPYEADVEEQRLIQHYGRLYPLLNLHHNPRYTQTRPFTKRYLKQVL